MSSSKSAALQQQYLEDERKSYFLVKHPRGQKVALIDRILFPLSQPTKLDGQTVTFKIAKVNHMVDSITLLFKMVVTRKLMKRLYDDDYSGSFTLVDLPAIRAIDEVQIHYAGDVINKFDSDAIRWDMHLFKTDAQKTAMRNAATDCSKPFVVKDFRMPEQTGYEASTSFAFRGSRGMDYHRARDIDTGHISFSVMPFKVQDTNNKFNVNGNSNVLQGITTSTAGTGTYGDTFENKIPMPFDDSEFTAPNDYGGIFGIASSFYGHASLAPASRTLTIYEIDAYSVIDDLELSWEVELPWTHGMSPDRNLPVVLLDDEPQVVVRFKESSKLLWSVSSGLGASGSKLMSLRGAQPAIYSDGNSVLTQSDFDTSSLYMKTASLRVSYREQSAALINALGSEPSITYPLSSYQSERFSLSPGAWQSCDIPVNSIRGLVHTIGFAVRDQNSINGSYNLHGNSFNTRWMTKRDGTFRSAANITNSFLFTPRNGIQFGNHFKMAGIQTVFAAGEDRANVPVLGTTFTDIASINSFFGGPGWRDAFIKAYQGVRQYYGSPQLNAAAVNLMHPNPATVRLYDYDFLDMSSVQTDCYKSQDHKKISLPGGQRMVEEWWIEANGERITGKQPINAVYGLTTYKAKHFPAHTELARHYAGDMHGTNEAAPCGLNLHVWTFGMDGDRAAVGSGTLNFDGLQSIKLHIKWYDNEGIVKAIAPSSSELQEKSVGLCNADGSEDNLLISYATPVDASILGGQCLGFPGIDSDIEPTFNKNANRYAEENLYIDMFAFGANFTTISGGNWFRQLTQ
jgi:hypothetical protein